jgi:F-type H+-transporting ATPase subunit b
MTGRKRVMRIRRFLAAGLLGVTAVLVVPHAAFAADDHGKELAECVESALADNADAIENEDYKAFENSLEDCKKSQSLFTPALPELVWGGIAFLIVLFVLMKFAFPALKKGLKAREEKIRSDLEGAEHARQEAESEKVRYQAQLSDARGEANRIVEEARLAAESVRTEVVAKAEADAAEVRNRANEDIRLARDRAMSDLQHQVGEISIGLAEKIVERNLDPDTQAALVESYINSVGK